MNPNQKNLTEEETQIINEVKSLFYNYKLLECIDKIVEVDLNRSIICHQTLSLYKGISLCESQQSQEGYHLFESIINESRSLKGEKYDDIDVLLRIYYHQEILYADKPKAEDMNNHLIQTIESYRQQNEGTDSYRKGIYSFGKGMYLLIENFRQKKRLEFAQYLEEAYELLDDLKQEVLIILAWAYYAKNENVKSLKFYNILYEMNPLYPSLSNNFAFVYQTILQYEKAEKLFLEAEKQCNFNVVILNNIASFYSNRKDYEKAELYMEKLIKLNPNNAKANHKYGAHLIKNGKETQGFKYLCRSEEIDPNYNGVLEEMFNYNLNNNNNQPQANKYIQKLIELYPNDGYYQYKLGTLYYRQGNLAEGIIAFQKGTTLKNYEFFRILSHSLIAQSYYKQQQYMKSLTEYFNTCNNESNYYVFLSEYSFLSTIINKKLPHSDMKSVINLINTQENLCIGKFQSISQQINDGNLKSLFQYRLDQFRSFLNLLAYRKEIQSTLTYQIKFSHLDLYFD